LEPTGRQVFAADIASEVVQLLGSVEQDNSLPFQDHLTSLTLAIIEYEGWFSLPASGSDQPKSQSELWALEDQLKRLEAIANNLTEVQRLVVALLHELARPLVEQHPQLLESHQERAEITFEAHLINMVQDMASQVEHLLHIPSDPALEPLILTPRLQGQIAYNIHAASGGVPNNPGSVRTPKLPTKQSNLPDNQLVTTYLGNTPLIELFNHPLAISLPQEIRFEHHHIIAGSGHGKTQTLQHLILRDLESVQRGETSIIVIDSQSDLIDNIAGLDCFAPGEPLADRLVLIDPTDIEWPVALNLFDVGQDRLDHYSPLDRERLTNSILELYDFVLGTLLDAGMTQKQNVIFRYITRLLLHIPDATIHTLRELLEPEGYEKYEQYIAELQGSARVFFENEFNGSEFKRTKQQVLRRLYGILENQTFERMFSHPKSKLDLFSEMNAGKVILINTAKDLLKENGTEIFGRFFIAMIAQAAQERAVLTKENRIPTFVYIDEASDYFDQNIGVILSQARKYNVGIVLAHQYLGQLDSKLHEAIAANTAIKFAGGVSAKDARSLASDLRTDASFIEQQKKLSFAAYIKGQTDRAVSIQIEPGQLEVLPTLSEAERQQQRRKMRGQYAVHYSELFDVDCNDAGNDGEAEDEGKPGVW
jgi:hypothetical protein